MKNNYRQHGIWQIGRSVVNESSVLFINTAKSLIWLLRMNKLKTKYKIKKEMEKEEILKKINKVEKNKRK